MQSVKLVISFFLAILKVISPIGGYIFHGGEDAFFTEWSETDEFTQDSYITLEKDPDKDFVILNLADVQLRDDEVYTDEDYETRKLIKEMVEKHNPDLITLSGDNAWGTMAYIELIRLVDSFGIPWAPVMGNHDGERVISEFWAAYLLLNAENCLFEFGPEGMGYGNYIINITENGRIIHTLFMVDTHNGAEFVNENGETVSGYDHLWDNQIEWYKWAVEGVEEIEGRTVESTVIMHIPVYEYKEAWAMFSSEETGTIDPAFDPVATGSNNEGVCSPPVRTEFFKVCKELGSTKNILCGHDHINNSQIYYEGIRLNYALKTGYGAYYTDDLMGATTITINSNGNANVEHDFVKAVIPAEE